MKIISTVALTLILGCAGVGGMRGYAVINLWEHSKGAARMSCGAQAQ